MTYRLLLVDAEGLARTPQLIIRQQREFPGGVGISVHFRPVRNDLLFESAKVTGQQNSNWRGARSLAAVGGIRSSRSARAKQGDPTIGLVRLRK
jgi:hypothetical protein